MSFSAWLKGPKGLSAICLKFGAGALRNTDGHNGYSRGNASKTPAIRDDEITVWMKGLKGLKGRAGAYLARGNHDTPKSPPGFSRGVDGRGVDLTCYVQAFLCAKFSDKISESDLLYNIRDQSIRGTGS